MHVKQEGLILKEQQVRALKLLSEGRDVFVWSPTWYGKSLCYQLLHVHMCYPVPFLMDYKLGRTNGPLVARSVVLVISPLVSLYMIDQVRSLNTIEVFLLPSSVVIGNRPKSCCH